MAAALLTSFALTAHADSPTVSGARQTYGSNGSVNPIHRLLFPTSTYMIDDGTTEEAVAVSNGSQNFQALWFNQFDVIPGQETIASVSIAWGSSVRGDHIDGFKVTIAIWSDPNGNGNPRDAELLGSTEGTVVNGATDAFVTYPFSPPVTLPPGATSFFVGNLTPKNHGPVRYYEGLDQSSTVRRSWVAAMFDGSAADIEHPGNNTFIGIIDDFGIPGNWLIRADAGDGSDNKTLTVFTRRGQGNTFVVLNWTPANGGSVNITRNGSLIATTDNDGNAEDNIRAFVGDLVYQVCDTDGSGCSNQFRLRVNPHAD